AERHLRRADRVLDVATHLLGRQGVGPHLLQAGARALFEPGPAGGEAGLRIAEVFETGDQLGHRASCGNGPFTGAMMPDFVSVDAAKTLLVFRSRNLRKPVPAREVGRRRPEPGCGRSPQAASGTGRRMSRRAPAPLDSSSREPARAATRWRRVQGPRLAAASSRSEKRPSKGKPCPLSATLIRTEGPGSR